MEGEEPVKISLNAKGEGKITAKSIKCPSGVEVVNKDQLIATITDKKIELEMEMEVNKGLGYIPVEQQQRDEKEIGVIAIDAIYTPIRRVNYLVEDMRVGKKTDFNKITLDIETDGSVTPEEAFKKSIDILVGQFSALGELAVEEKEVEKKEEAQLEEKEEDKKEEAKDPLKLKISELKGLSNRTVNVLEENKVEKVKDVVKMKEDELKELKGMGDKGIKEIRKAIGEFGLTLK
jgi:DNA-directed RNA polymerase subunit alpha